MTTAATSLLGLALPVTGELSGTWGDTVNNSITALLDSAVAGTTTLSADVDVTLTTTTLAANQAREAIILWTAAGTVTRYITAPAQSKIYAVLNKSSTQSIVLRGVGPTTGVTILAGKQAMVAWDGTDYVEISSGYVDGPATSTDNAVARFDGTDGKLLQNSVVIIADTTGNMTGVGTLSSGAITSSALTATRVLFAGTSGLIQDDADLTFNGTILTSTGFAGPLNGTVGATTPAAGYFTDVSATGQVTSTKAGSATTGAGQFYLNGATSNRIDFNSNGATTPSFTTRSDGTKLTLFPALSGSQVDYAIGISAATQWYSVPVNSNSFFFKWFGGETQIASLDGTGALTLAGGVTLSGGTANGVAYLNASKVLTSGTALTFDGTNLGVGGASGYEAANRTTIAAAGVNSAMLGFKVGSTSSGYVFSDASHVEFGAPTGRYISWDINGEQMRLTSTGLEVKQSQLIGYSSYAGIGTNGLAVAGNVGIGTSSPTSKLEVSATNAIVQATGTTGWSGYSVTKTNGSLIFGLDDGGTFGQADGAAIIRNASGKGLFYYNSTTLRLALDSSGNLGLGVSPSAWAAGTKAIEIGASSSISNIGTTTGIAVGANIYRDGSWKYKLSGERSTLYNQYNGEHSWSTAGTGTADTAISFTQAMTLDASGNLLVGTTSNTGGLLSGANIIINGGATYCNVGHVAGTSDGSTYHQFAYNGSTIGSIAQSGTTAVLYNTSSDYRLKNITGPITTSGAYIDSLKPVEGTWKADGSTFVGLIAHETQEASRTTVATGTKDGEQMQGMDYSSAEIIANLIAEIQDLRKRLAAAGI